MKKRLLSLALLLALLGALATVPAAAATGISVNVDGTAVKWTDAAPFIGSDGRTMVPLRAIADAMGLTVEWDSVNRLAIFSRTYTEDEAIYGMDSNDDNVFEGYFAKAELYFQPGSSSALLRSYYAMNGKTEIEGYLDEEIAMDTAPVIVGGRTYAPARYLAESFDFDVFWDSEGRTVNLLAPVFADDIETYGLETQLGGVCNTAGQRSLTQLLCAKAGSKVASVEITAAFFNGSPCTIYRCTPAATKTIAAAMNEPTVTVLFDMNFTPRMQLDNGTAAAQQSNRADVFYRLTMTDGSTHDCIERFYFPYTGDDGVTAAQLEAACLAGGL